MRLATLLAGLCCATWAWPLAVALAADPLKSPGCSSSLAGLEAARAVDGGTAEVEELRRQALQACLGGSGQARRPSPVAQSPIKVPPPAIEVPQPPRPAPQPLPPAPPLQVDRPDVVTTCDPGGCWTREGIRLNRSGALLIGPAGACVSSGAMVQCP